MDNKCRHLVVIRNHIGDPHYYCRLLGKIVDEFDCTTCPNNSCLRGSAMR